VKLTAQGWQAIFFSALSLLVAQLIGTTQIYQIGYALAGLLLAALVLGLFLSRGLRYVRLISEGERLVAGRPCHVKLVVSNVLRTRSPGVEIVDHLPELRLFQTPPVDGSGTRKIQEPVLFARRGLYELGPAEIRTTDPFGLLRFTRRFGGRTEALVYPEVFELVGFPLRGRSRDMGARGSSFAQQGDEFSGLREYRRGDDRRHIHWKSVARTGELIVKEFAQNAPQRHTVVLDLHCRGIGAPEVEVENAVSAAGSVLWHLAREGLPFRLLCTNKARGEIAFGADEATYWRAMDLLALVQADGDVEPGDFLDEKLREEREELGEGVVLISRSLGDIVVKSVEKLRAAGLSVVIVALAAHTYRSGGASSRREVPFDEDIRRLRLAGVEVCVLSRPGGMAAFAGGQGAANTRGMA
jgi:uncharacterized protein (DUF58 family)